MWRFSTNDWMELQLQCQIMDNGTCNGRTSIHLDSNAYLGSNTTHFKDDYNKVNVPMLTAVQSEKTSARAIAISTVVMVLFSVAPFFITTESGEPMIGRSIFGQPLLLVHFDGRLVNMGNSKTNGKSIMDIV